MRRGWKAKPQRWQRGSRCGARGRWRKRFRWRRWKSWMRLCRNASRRCMCRPQHWSRRSRKRGKAWRALSRPCPEYGDAATGTQVEAQVGDLSEMSGYAIRTCCPDAAGLRPTGSMRSRKRDWCVSRSRRKSGRRRGQDWKGVHLTLASADPGSGLQPSNLPNWTLRKVEHMPGRSPRARHGAGGDGRGPNMMMKAAPPLRCP